ncbi:hypothetical protein EYC80_007663 [Monilinia laxa]|uniref:Secreted protein n=1 Tax=Monilinia laxa TaxID=61186 RepID=A0A5N6JWL2_MONLA|nr:hypothetical protein EYC80_007663 [Monilinia laxa]
MAFALPIIILLAFIQLFHDATYIVFATLSIRETNSDLDRVTQLRQSHVHVTLVLLAPHPISITSNPGYHVGDLCNFSPKTTF